METGYAAKAKASVLTPLGIKWEMDSPELFLTEAERHEAKILLNNMGIGSEPFITIDPSHRRETRRWPMQHFIEFLRILETEYPQLKVLILWGPGEKETADMIAQEAAGNSVVPGDMRSLHQIAAVQERAVMHFGNSHPPPFRSGHGPPTATIQGATKHSWRFPSDDHLSLVRRSGCHFCNKNNCALGTRECLVENLPEQIYADLSEHLRKCFSHWETK